MTARAHVDFETRSYVDLLRCGAHVYAADPSTDILVMAWCISDGIVTLWRPGDPFPAALAEHIAAGGEMWAHNAQFERLIWQHAGRRHGFPDVRLEQWHCTAALAANMGLPRSLGDAAAALGGEQPQKDPTGRRIMLKLSQPRRDGGGFWTRETAPADFAHLDRYCAGDVLAERGLTKRLYAIQPVERDIYLLDQRINDRGIRLDRVLVGAMQDIVDGELARINARIGEITGYGATAATQVARILSWCESRGVTLPGLAAGDIRHALKHTDMPNDVEAVLLLRQEAAKSSTAKLAAFTDCAGNDDRCRGLLLYAGAARTRRWAGRLAQPQNLPRGTLPEEDMGAALQMVLRRETDALRAIYGSALDAVSSLLRGCLVAEAHHDLLSADYANIEGRALAWLAGEEWKLEAFRAFDRKEGPDLYRVAYSRAMGTPVRDVTGKQRQVGKVIELACGYQGWTGAFQAFATLYGLDIPDHEAAQFAGAWRDAHPATVRFWHALNDAALRAVATPGRKFAARGVEYLCANDYLWCRLPSGGVLAYCRPSLKKNDRGEIAVHFWGVDSVTKRWVEIGGYGGLWAENVTQAVCRDLLAGAMLRLNRAGYPIVLTVHDEIVCEMPRGRGSLDEMRAMMTEIPAWADGLPVVAEGWRGERYRK